MKENIKFTNFRRILTSKCEKEHENFDQQYERIKTFSPMEKEDYLFALQDVQVFKNQFLIPHYKMYNLLEVLNKEIFNLRKKELSEEELQLAINELEEMKTELANSRIEIYFCNVLNNQALKPLANAVMPYGLIHVGIKIDDLCIQWGRSIIGKSLVIPWGDVIYNDYIFAIELENREIWNLIKETFQNLRNYITNKKDYNQMGTVKAFQIADNQLKSIAEVSIKYNVKKDYNIVLKNCQHFANKIIKKLGFKVDQGGEVGEVLKKAKDLLNPFDFEFRGMVFKCRKDLDDYVLINDFFRLFKEERRLLLCIRNVFDFYAKYRPDEPKYKSSEIALAYWNDLAEIEKFG